MLSQASKTHWGLAFKAVRKAIKVTLQDIGQTIKAWLYINKISDDIFTQRKAISIITRDYKWQEEDKKELLKEMN